MGTTTSILPVTQHPSALTLSPTMPSSLVDQVAVEPLGSDNFVSRCLPLRMGNAMPIAYGGCSISIGLSSAVATVKAGYNPYSVMGHFHGPAATDRKLYTSVQRTRDTRSFATRRVQVKQKQDDGKERVVMDLMVDFTSRTKARSSTPVLQRAHGPSRWIV